MDIQFAIDTMNAVPTPRLGVGEKQFAAQLLHISSAHGSTRQASAVRTSPEGTS